MKNLRANLILLFVFAFGLAIIGKLFFIQVIQGDRYKAYSQGLQYGGADIISSRGDVMFSGGEYLAVNMEWPILYASPDDVVEKEKTAILLADAFGLDKDELLAKLGQEGIYEKLKERLNAEEVKKYKELGLEGIHLGKEMGRYYPQERLASRMIGFLDPDGQGQYGLEEYYDNTLAGSSYDLGDDIVLTIDYSVQHKAEKLLGEAKENLNIEEGEIIVIDPFTGEVLAMANYPNFNPNSYSEVDDIGIFKNSITQDLFEPGSVMKTVTMAAAINEGKVSPSTTYIDKGVVYIGGRSIRNYNERIFPGDIPMTEVLERSINTGAVFIQQQLGDELFASYLEKFGVFEESGIDLNENFSYNSEFKKGYEVGFATASFGQGIAINSMQLVKMYCAIANGGDLIRPYVVSKIKKGGTDEEIETKPKTLRKGIISQNTASKVAAMLVNVIENGYSKVAKIPGYYLGGKTGTAQISYSALNREGRGYSEESYQSFIGLIPAFEPRYVALVKLKNPETRTAEYSATPIFKDLAEYIINYKQIPPDYEI